MSDSEVQKAQVDWNDAMNSDQASAIAYDCWKQKLIHEKGGDPMKAAQIFEIGEQVVELVRASGVLKKKPGRKPGRKAVKKRRAKRQHSTGKDDRPLRVKQIDRDERRPIRDRNEE